MHARAFDGLNILIFGQEPLLPMRVEQAMASAMPNLEIGLESFEDYHQALTHSRASGRCGLVMVLDSKSTLPLNDVLINLLKPWEESTGIPGAAVLLAVAQPTLTGYQIAAHDRRILSYQGIQEFLDQARSQAATRTIWSDFVDRLEAYLVPDACADWLIALANERGVDPGTINFTRRLANFFRLRTNLNWREAMALPWFPITDALQHYRASIGMRGRALFELADVLGSRTPRSDSLSNIVRAGQSTVSRLSSLVAGLDYRRLQGSLAADLAELSRTIKPFDPALLRITASESAKILEFAADATTSSTLLRAG